MELTVSMGTPLDRNTVVAAVAALMPRDMLGDAATLGDGTDSVQAGRVVRQWEYPPVPAQTPVFVDDALAMSSSRILETTPVFWRLMFIHSCSSK